MSVDKECFFFSLDTTAVDCVDLLQQEADKKLAATTATSVEKIIKKPPSHAGVGWMSWLFGFRRIVDESDEAVRTCTFPIYYCIVSRELIVNSFFYHVLSFRSPQSSEGSLCLGSHKVNVFFLLSLSGMEPLVNG